MDVDTASVISTLTLNIYLLITLLIIFNIFRHNGGGNAIYAPKLIKRKHKRDSQKYTKLNLFSHSISKGSLELHESAIYFDPNDCSFFQLFVKVFDYECSSKDIGLDMLTLLNYLKLCFKISYLCTAIGLVFLLPFYRYQAGLNNITIGINAYSVANIQPNSLFLWIPVIFTYLFTLIFLSLITKEYEHFAQLRQDYFKTYAIRSISNYTVMIRNIPMELRTNQKLKSYLEETYRCELIHVNIIALNIQELDNLVKERQEIIIKLENMIAEDMAIKSSETNLTLSPLIIHNKNQKSNNNVEKKPSIVYGIEVVDKISFWEKRLDQLNEQIEKLKSEIIQFQENPNTENNTSSNLNLFQMLTKSVREDTPLLQSKQKSDENIHENNQYNNNWQMSSTGFATFLHRANREEACSTHPIPTTTSLADLFIKYPRMTIKRAPEPNDIIWNNLTSFSIPFAGKSTFFTSIALYLGLLFWSVIITFISALSNLSNFEKYLPFIHNLNPVIYTLLEGQLPVIVLIIFISMLPVFMTIIFRDVDKMNTIGSIQKRLLKWIFLYQIANVYLTVVGGSLFNMLELAIESPISILNLLGTAIPSVSIFFTNFIITQLFTGLPVLLLRLPQLLIYKFYTIYFPEKKLTRRSLLGKGGPLDKVSILYGTAYPTILYIFWISVIYWVMTPLLLLFATCFFGGCYMVYKYQIIFIFEKSYETGGALWYRLFYYSMLGLLFSSFTMIGYMGIKQGAYQFSSLLPLPIIIILIWRDIEDKFKKLSMNAKFYTNISNGSIIGENQNLQDEIVNSFDFNSYLQPSLSTPSVVKPYPYRIANISLLDEVGNVNDIYYNDNPIVSELQDFE
eukprot:gene4989-6974_t